MGYHSTPAGICKGVFYEDFVNSLHSGALGAYAPPAALRTEDGAKCTVLAAKF